MFYLSLLSINLLFLGNLAIMLSLFLKINSVQSGISILYHFIEEKKKRGKAPLFLMFFNYLQEKILLFDIDRAKV